MFSQLKTLLEKDLYQGLFICIVSVVVLLVFPNILTPISFKIDERKIVNFIKNSKHTFRSTEAICAHTSLDTDRIKKVASKSKKLKRNSAKKESWCLKE
jgi:hypothetical protein